ncbi:MAG: PepSY-like domain-containing protein [Paraprevotella sp.]|nr:PepSY-like domain-containing protein [Paraprevotella sp.]
MKKIVTTLFLVIVTVASLWAGDVITRNTDQLPAAAKTSISKNFPKAKISYIKIDKSLTGNTYEVILTNGAKVEFNSKGEWKEVDCKKGVVPNAYIPATIRNNLKKEFPGVTVKKIEKKMRRYEVELSNGLDADFDLQGNLLKLDD